MSHSYVSARANAMESFKVMDVLKRANELQNEGHTVIHCEVGQPETGAPPTVALAAIEALSQKHPASVLGYTDSFGLLQLRQKICQHYQSKYFTNCKSPTEISASAACDTQEEEENSPSTATSTTTNDWDTISTNRIVVTTGSSGAFLLAFTACFDVGDVVAIASAGYPCYRNILQALGCILVHLEVNDEFKVTATTVLDEIHRRKMNKEQPIRGLVLSSPSNPTGAMLSPTELHNLCTVTDNNQIQFISDEIYHGITYGKPEATALQYSSKVIVINSFSKYYSMSGWRLGWMIVPDTLIEPITSLQQNMFINAPTISQTAALKCWDDDTKLVLEQHVEKYKQSRSIILQELKQFQPPLYTIAPADGGFYVYVDVGPKNVVYCSDDNDNVDCTSNSTSKSSKIHNEYGTVALCAAFLEEYHVALTPGIDFEDPSTNLGNRRFRISYSQGIDVTKEAMKRLLQFWPTWMERIQSKNATTTTTTSTS